ncbi:MAG: BMP family ABC transporter substrate-binding protein [Chloroflexi bacterium CFX1]|nr:BMP family ABC transporter substrate-binding protein [Chloroflexi bacterium CFX1]
MRIRDSALRIANYFFLTTACWALTACGSSSDCFREDVFCAALVTDTLGVKDHGINQDAWAGLEEAKANGLADRVEYIESMDSRDYGKNIAYFADQGFDLIFTSGAALDDATLQNADLYPDSAFVGLNQTFEESRQNLASLTFPEDQMGFAAGVLAARLTKTKIVAAICETSGIGSWGYETGEDVIRRGADVVFAAGGVTGQGALRAASEHGIRAIGAERDQAALGESGSGVVASFYGDARLEVRETMRRMREGGKAGAGIGSIKFANPPPEVPPSAVSELEILLSMLKNGEIKTNVPFEKP